MNNLVLITSIIKNPLLNTKEISINSEAFLLTINTIKSVRERIPNSKILLVECSEFTEEEYNILNSQCDFIINLFSSEIKHLIYSPINALGEGIMTLFALELIIQNNLTFDNLFKISGRYWLSDYFNYDLFNNNNIVVKYINNKIITTLYKIPFLFIKDYHTYLLNNLDMNNSNDGSFTNNNSNDELLTKFVNNIFNYKIININPIGVAGTLNHNEYYFE
jgi:hypothetical protein